MSSLLTHLDFVLVTSQPPGLKKMVSGKQGLILGMSDPYSDGHRDYAVHFNDLGESCTISEYFLKSTGLRANREQIITRSRLHRNRRKSRSDVDAVTSIFSIPDFEFSLSGTTREQVTLVYYQGPASREVEEPLQTLNKTKAMPSQSPQTGSRPVAQRQTA